MRQQQTIFDLVNKNEVNTPNNRKGQKEWIRMRSKNKARGIESERRMRSDSRNNNSQQGKGIII